MAGRLFTGSLTVPAGTTAAAPVSGPFAILQGHVDAIEVIVPDGHNGLTGIAVLWGGSQIIPFTAGSWLVANDDRITTPVDQDVNDGSITLQGYNTDVFPHTFYLRATWGQPPPPPAVTASLATDSIAGTDTTTADLGSLGDLGDSTGGDQPPVDTSSGLVTVPVITAPGSPPKAPAPQQVQTVKANGKQTLDKIATDHKNTLTEARRLNPWYKQFVGKDLPKGYLVRLIKK